MITGYTILFQLGVTAKSYQRGVHHAILNGYQFVNYYDAYLVVDEWNQWDARKPYRVCPRTDYCA